MGIWGTGNFESDTAADYLSLETDRLTKSLASTMDGPESALTPGQYASEAVPCEVELLALLAEQRWVGTVLPTREAVTTWKARYLAAWDAGIGALKPKAEWRPARRAVLEATWDRLLARTEPAPVASPKKTKKRAR